MTNTEFKRRLRQARTVRVWVNHFPHENDHTQRHEDYYAASFARVTKVEIREIVGLDNVFAHYDPDSRTLFVG